MKLVFERAKKEDLEEIHEIEIASFPDPWSVDSLWAFASNEQVRTLVCARDEETSELVGYYALQYVLDEAEIAIIAVKRKFRRQGLGRAILDEIKRFCGEREIIKIHLEVRSENEAAVHLYRSFGFEEVGRRKNYYEAPKDDALLFSLSI
ncbi:MAG: ribosomal protein S18-alanine N-acetyltransferase [Clostridiales bacterium]|nr:ribosomal protein S18-alanine N-acetyltransferase [Clostridiales bacterium]MBR5417370.1 ribosomal protein S18-alanine N-acetyltransferase [Clostridiales bacterium]